MPSIATLALDIAAFAAMALIVFVVGRRIEATLSVRRRLRGDAPQTAMAGSTGTLLRSNTPRNPILAWVQQSTLKDPEERRGLRRDLARAGFESQAAPAIYVVVRFCLAVGLPVGFLFAQKFLDKPMTGLTLILFPLALAGLGLMAPRAFIDNRAGARRRQLENEFPDALDLMVVCVESGLGLEGALLRVGNETDRSHPRTAHEFNLVSQELRAGRTRAEALRNLAERAQVEMVKSFVALLIQTDQLGGSVALTLRTYSSEMRQHRMLKAEEKAMRLPVLLTIPLVGFILPVIFTSVLLPAVISAIRQFLPAMGGK